MEIRSYVNCRLLACHILSLKVVQKIINRSKEKLRKEIQSTLLLQQNHKLKAFNKVSLNAQLHRIFDSCLASDQMK